MARPKIFDPESALDAAIEVFSQHGYEGTSASALTSAMGIGRQSLYDTFGDKWQLYLAALRRYVDRSASAQITALRAAPRALDGIAAHFAVLVEDASGSSHPACLGVGAVCEFGRSKADVCEITEASNRVLTRALEERVSAAQAEGDVGNDLDPTSAAQFLVANLVAIKIAARGGAGRMSLQSIADMALRSLR
jgi:TetR/AcrR family transcriptional repressor of nem operon